jgi:type IV pilus assembly protein PilE
VAQAHSAAGFTLIEVMIALAVVAITTMIAASSYRNYVRRSHRVQAVQALLVAAAEQEKFYLANGRYGDRLDAAPGEDPPGLPVASQTPGGHYVLSVTVASAANYRIVATGIDNGGDPLCHTLAIDESGRRTATDVRGADSAGRCW